MTTLSKTTSLDSLSSKVLADPEARKEYEALKPEFELISTLLKMRNSAGLTQQQVAERMGTQEANISRLEKGKGNPTIKTLLNYAKACSCELHFNFNAV